MLLHVGPSLVVVTEGELPTGMYSKVPFMVRLFFSAALCCHPEVTRGEYRYCRQETWENGRMVGMRVER